MGKEDASYESLSSGRTETRLERPIVEPSAPFAYVLVFEGDSATVFELPESGKVVVGRQQDADLRLEDKQISRAHCEITTAFGRATIVDLGSHNGTLVNGDRITAPRLLVSGDVITLSDTTLVFQARVRTEARRELLEFDELCRRARQAVHQAERLGHPFALVVLTVGARDFDSVPILAAAGDNVRSIDLIGRGAGDQILVGMPGMDPSAAKEAATRLIAVVQEADMRLRPRAGVAAAPSDGSDFDTLLASASAAASAGRPGEVNLAGAAAATIDVGDHSIIVLEPAMKRLYALVERLAKADIPVIIHGETGTGKDVAAQALHHWSARKDGPLVAVNCAALPEALAESELFGHAKGAFSGAVESKAGFLEAASSGTIFLDEIGELPLPIQAKLLRALERKRVQRLGEVQERIADCRVVAATNGDLGEEVKAGRFRQDLFFRLKGATLWIPPLRDRPRELPVMARAFLADACRRVGRAPMESSDEALRALCAHKWPGNIRELKHVLDYVAAAYPESVLEREHVEDALQTRPELGPEPGAVASVEEEIRGERAWTFRPIEEEVRELEKDRIRRALIAARGNQRRAARLISMPLRTFVSRLKDYDLKDEVRSIVEAESADR